MKGALFREGSGRLKPFLRALPRKRPTALEANIKLQVVEYECNIADTAMGINALEQASIKAISVSQRISLGRRVGVKSKGGIFYHSNIQ